MAKKLPTLATTIAERIHARILRSGLGPGDHLGTSEDLAKDFGVSPGTIREAIGRLKGQGIVAGRRKSGMFIKQPKAFEILKQTLPLAVNTKEGLVKLWELRVAVELGAIPMVINGATEERLQELEDVIVTPDQLDKYSLTEFRREDLKFHDLLLDLSNNEYLMQMKELIHDFCLTYWKKTKPFIWGPGGAQTCEEHRRIITAVRARDLPNAIAVMAQHLGVYRNYMEAQ